MGPHRHQSKKVKEEVYYCYLLTRTRPRHRLAQVLYNNLPPHSTPSLSTIIISTASTNHLMATYSLFACTPPLPPPLRQPAFLSCPWTHTPFKALFFLFVTLFAYLCFLSPSIHTRRHPALIGSRIVYGPPLRSCSLTGIHSLLSFSRWVWDMLRSH
jgi:hypothetical protein